VNGTPPNCSPEQAAQSNGWGQLGGGFSFGFPVENWDEFVALEVATTPAMSYAFQYSATSSAITTYVEGDALDLGPGYLIAESYLVAPPDVTLVGVTVTPSATVNGQLSYGWVPGLAPMANGAMQAFKQLAKGQPTPTAPKALPEVPGTAPEIVLEDPFWKNLFKLFSRWLGGGGLGPLPPSTVIVPVVNPCVIPSFQNTQMCGGGGA